MHDGNFPEWLHIMSLVSVVFGALCSAAIAVDEFRYPQKMWIMNIVWPLTALFGTVLWLAAYYAWGRNGRNRQRRQPQPFAVMVTKGTSHCGAGCTLADIIVEWSAFAFPALASWFGWLRIPRKSSSRTTAKRAGIPREPERRFHSKASAADVATRGEFFYSFSSSVVKPFRRLRIDSPDSVSRCAL